MKWNNYSPSQITHFSFNYELISLKTEKTVTLFIITWRSCFSSSAFFLGGRHLLTQGDAVDFGPLGVWQVPVHLLDDLLFHLRDGVTVQHLDGRNIRPLALNQHLQGLTNRIAH